MTTRTWIRRLFARPPRTRRPAPARFRPRLEALEDRVTPTVTPTAMVDVTSGVLTFTGATASSSYSLTGTATTYTFNSSEGISVDAGAAAAGWTVNGNSATGPSSRITSIDFTSTAGTESAGPGASYLDERPKSRRFLGPTGMALDLPPNFTAAYLAEENSPENA